MLTNVGMRRRGYPSAALNRFRSAVGVSRATKVIGMHVLEYWVRSELEANAKRVLAVLRLLRLITAHVRGGEKATVPNHAANAAIGRREIKLSRTLYIDEMDFRMEESKVYYGLPPVKTAMLRYVYHAKSFKVVTRDNGKPCELISELEY